MKAQLEPRDSQQQTRGSQAMERIASASPLHLARMAGALYLIVIVGGFFSIGFVPAVIVVPGDAAATAHNILTHELLYWWGIASHMVTLLCNIPLMLIFYELFKVVNKRLSLLVLFFLLVGEAVEGANLLNQFTPLMLLGGGHYLSVFNTEQLQALAYVPLDPQAISYNVQQVFYAFYCLLLG